MVKNEVIEKVKDLIAAPSVYAGLKAVAEDYLASLGASGEKDKAKVLVDAIEESVQKIDDVIAFFESDAGKNLYGAETAANIVNHGREIKEKGAVYCDCLACSAGKAILDNKDAIL